MTGYWGGVLQARINRRRALLGAASMGGAAALLAACGGGEKSTGEQGTNLVRQELDETKSLKKGGRYIAGIRGGGYIHMDPHTAVIQPYGYIYSNLVRIKNGYMGPADGTMEGDLWQSWEVSPDKLTLTGKMNPKAQFAPTAPVNGRKVDTTDIQATWERFKQIASYRNELVNEVEPTAPVLSLTTPDLSTVVLKLKQPYSPILGLLAANRSGSFNIIPKEAAEGKVDLRTSPVGSGPWMVKEWEPSSYILYARNPNYKHDQIDGVPYVDEYQGYFIQEPAVHEAQFRAGALHETAFFPAERVLPTKLENPVFDMYSTGTTPNVGVGWIIGKTPESPFKDVRVRQAMSLSYDHEIIAEAFGDLARYTSAGIDVEMAKQCALPCDVAGYLNPESKEFGPNVKYLQENLPEAKKLLAAAGFANGIDTTVNYPPGYNPGLVKQIETVLGEFGRTGLIRYKINHIDYNVEWTPKYRLIRGQIPDLALISAASGSEDPTINLQSKYHSSGSAYFHGNDSITEDLLTKALQEFDDAKRKELLYEVQRHEAEMLHMPFAATGSGGFELIWPAVRNWRVYQGNRHFFRTVWLDQTKPPFRPA